MSLPPHPPTHTLTFDTPSLQSWLRNWCADNRLCTLRELSLEIRNFKVVPFKYIVCVGTGENRHPKPNGPDSLLVAPLDVTVGLHERAEDVLVAQEVAARHRDGAGWEPRLHAMGGRCGCRRWRSGRTHYSTLPTEFSLQCSLASLTTFQRMRLCRPVSTCARYGVGRQ